MTTYEITDHNEVYPIHKVEVTAKSLALAVRLALEAMMGASIQDVDEEVVRDMLKALEIYERVPTDFGDGYEGLTAPTYEGLIIPTDEEILRSR